MSRPDPTGPGPIGPGPTWRSGKLWHRIGYAFTAIWIVGIILVTGQDVTHPLFDLIFIVPLGFWIVGLTIANLLKRR